MTQAPERERTPHVVLPAVRRDEGAWLPAFLLALRTSFYGLVAVELVVLLLWVGASHSGASASQTLRLGLTFWAAAHHADVHVGPHAAGASIGLVPLGLTLLPGWLLFRGTRTLLRADPDVEPTAFVPALAVCHAVLVTVAALVARTATVQPQVAEAFVGGAVVAAGAGSLAALVVRGRHPRVPGEVAVATGAAVRVAGLLLAAGLVATAALVVAHLGDVATAQRALHPGGTGTAGLWLLQLLALPTAAVWGSSVLAGPGFGLGAGTSVSLTGAHLHAVPALPVLAALPGHGTFPPLLWLALAVPVAAGALGARRVLTGDDWRAQLRPAAAAAAASGLLWAVLAWLADGAAGPGRLHVAGPSPWQLGLTVAGETALGLLLVVGARAARRHRASR